MIVLDLRVVGEFRALLLKSDLEIDLMSELERGYFVMNLDEIDDQQLSQ